MKRRGLLAAAALVVVANAIALLGVARNRASTVQTIDLTERELALGYQDEENSGIDLRFVFNRQPNPDWFNAAKLQDLGFKTAVPSDGMFPAIPERSAYVAFEYDGPAWQAVLSKELARPGAQAVYVEAQPHLVPVDVSRDSETLLAKYGSTGRHLIVRATVTSTVDFRDGRRSMQGRIVEILPQEIHVPLPEASVLEKARLRPADTSQRPHYTVHLANGAHFEPWVVSVTALPK
jgi:hypothetical protein